MFKIYTCIAYAHDLRLVGLAALVCVLASFAAINLLRHAQKSSGQTRGMWLAVSAISTGFGIFATHFIAMLAFTPGIPSGYNVVLTMLSLVAAILLTGAGLAVSLTPNWRHGPWLGGAIVAGGIAAMHYTGMAAFEIEGTILWDPVLVVTSIVLGAAIGAVALPVGLHGKEEKWKIGGALLLTLAICSHHFTAMGAVSIIPDPTIEVSPSALPAGLLAIGVAIASVAIIALALAGVVLDIRDQRRSELEVERMRDLADASVEGLLVCDGEAIVSVNTSFAHLAGLPAATLVGEKLEYCFPDQAARTELLSGSNKTVETALRHLDGSTTPVELILRSIVYAGRPHQVIAVRDLKARKDAEQHIYFLAHHDALTSLPNRSHFNARIDQEIAALTAGKSLAVLCLDLDKFKEVNDLFGHTTGDKVLQMVASRVTAVLGERQMMARLGGDEFAILMPDVANPAAASRLAETILEALRASSDAADTRIATSIGIALCPDDAADRHSLLTHADTALYRAKNEGRNTYRFFEAKMGVEVRERRLLEHDLRHAIARDELRLVYQPQKVVLSDTISGFEALLRWRHPTRGEISPAVFIPIAEETGAILQIGDWVLRTACREAASWTQPLKIAVNVSAVQLYNASFVGELHQILLDTGLPPRRLEIEITETALVRDFNRALAMLRQIKAIGIAIAMDDFGTGYSSLSNLRAFPFDRIKIDGSFIKSVNSNGQAATIVRAVLGLGRGLGLPVIAEGVETAAELKFLQDESCTEVQGYLLGRPAAIGSFRHYTHGDVALDESDDVTMRPAQRA
ncbi:PAS domain S-box-containing protein/diguanylate cyclase (GGDEF) domain-containing protein [Bradyrhizobium lablabi]|uniref:PAS domain S-box-containing protein/diguanylate cyclase (GGDEF) domain-containing protein n=1 Tax=Bradyrhizobium lablabi TaxID=722472 RepID=A0A1M6WR30_9BRAD|nr:EAL domain-containing protein [Bradyrhizobium lablabi]SHK96168.1 PAS domain S-box-containing protein/diguanylate cyclase (GGDEF) domain-containing protein [Bradyrhizobium lablabi]